MSSRPATDLQHAVGRLMYFQPQALRSFDSEPNERVVAGLVLRAPCLPSGVSPSRVLPREAYQYTGIKWTARSTPGGGQTGDYPAALIGSIMKIALLEDHTRGPRPEPVGGKELEERIARAVTECHAEILRSGLQPCLIVFEEGQVWTWVRDGDFSLDP